MDLRTTVRMVAHRQYEHAPSLQGSPSSLGPTAYLLRHHHPSIFHKYPPVRAKYHRAQSRATTTHRNPSRTATRIPPLVCQTRSPPTPSAPRTTHHLTPNPSAAPHHLLATTPARQSNTRPQTPPATQTASQHPTTSIPHILPFPHPQPTDLNPPSPQQNTARPHLCHTCPPPPQRPYTSRPRRHKCPHKSSRIRSQRRANTMP